MKTFTIGQVAREAGVGVETVRFYEREGLIEAPSRRASGYRQYGDETVVVLKFIRRAKELGFTLKEIRSLMDLRLDSSASRGDVRQLAQEKVADIETRIHDLQRMRDTLVILIRKCSGRGKVPGCPILHAMEDDEIPSELEDAGGKLQ